MSGGGRAVARGLADTTGNLALRPREDRKRATRARALRTASSRIPGIGPLLGLAVVTATLPALGCGRRATPADCQLIVDKSVDLQLKDMDETDAAAIKASEAKIRAALEDQIKECESRRVTDKTIACVRDAKTRGELDECLR